MTDRPAQARRGETGRPGDVWIGLDLGTSSLKGIAADVDGHVVASATAGYPTSRPAPGAAEQDPDSWIAAIEQVARRLGAEVPPARWRGIGLSAMLPTLLTASADGLPTGPAITWEDSRAEPQSERLREAFGAITARGEHPDEGAGRAGHEAPRGDPGEGAGRGGGAGSAVADAEAGGERLYRLTGQWVDGRYLLPMFLRLAEAEPERAAATASLLGAKDYLFGWLTGEVATDPSTAAGFGCYALEPGRWDGAVLAAAATVLGARPPALPTVLPATASRPLRPDATARLGCGRIPVCVGAADSVLGAFGMGARSPGQIAYVAGTSTVILGITDTLRFDPRHRFMVTPLAEPGGWGLEMDLLATGSALRWLAGLLGDGMNEAALVALAAGTDPRQAPVVLPYLSPGEQGALWDPSLHGAISGLTLAHQRRHLARGMLNGILLESRRCLDVLDQTGPFGPELLAVGGSAVEPAFRADLADVTGRRVIRPGGGEASHSALGAALLAARSAGASQAVTGTADTGRADTGPADTGPADTGPAGTGPAGGLHHAVSDPDLDRAALWAALWARHERARLALGAAPAADADGDRFG